MFIQKSRVTCHVNVHHASALHGFYNALCTDNQSYVCGSGGTFALVESLVQSHLYKFCITQETKSQGICLTRKITTSKTKELQILPMTAALKTKELPILPMTTAL